MSRRVLLVDDESLAVLQMRELLADIGCDMIVELSAATALIRLERGDRFDLAVVDVGLHGEGLPVIEASWELQPGVPVIGTTEYGDVTPSSLCAQMRTCPQGEFVMLRKPWLPADFLDSVQDLLTA